MKNKVVLLLLLFLALGSVAFAGNTQCVNCVINGRALPPTGGINFGGTHSQTFKGYQSSQGSWHGTSGSNQYSAGSSGSQADHQPNMAEKMSRENREMLDSIMPKRDQPEPATKKASPAAMRMAMVNQKVKECNDAFAIEGKVEVYRNGAYGITPAPAGETCNLKEAGFDCKSPSYEDALKGNFCQCLRECRKTEQ